MMKKLCLVLTSPCNITVFTQTCTRFRWPPPNTICFLNPTSKILRSMGRWKSMLRSPKKPRLCRSTRKRLTDFVLMYVRPVVYSFEESKVFHSALFNYYFCLPLLQIAVVHQGRNLHVRWWITGNYCALSQPIHPSWVSMMSMWCFADLESWAD